MQSIRDLWHKIKPVGEYFAEEWGIPAIVLLVGVTSFGLGRLSAFEEAKPVVSVTTPSLLAQPTQLHMGGLVVANATGSVYYLPWCSGAQKIPLSKQRWFSDEKSAQKAGYKAAKGCKGLSGEGNSGQ